MSWVSLLLLLWTQIVVRHIREIPPESLLCIDSPQHRSHNNIDLIHYQGEYFLALRTAPTHFPSKRAELRILRSSNLEDWQCDTVLRLQRDIREPRWLVWKEKLFLYYFVGADKPWRFQSAGIQGMVREAGRNWNHFSVGWPGWVPWRARAHDSVAYLSLYWGENLYRPHHQAEVRLLMSRDGYTWTPISNYPQVTAPYATETDFWISSKGQLWAIARAEGLGSYLCWAESPSAPWQCKPLPYKYDSPWLFEAPDGLYLIARRSLSGVADRAPRWWPLSLRRMYNLAYYSLTRKRTALYRVDTLSHTVEWIQDLPGWGDTAFPTGLWKSETELLLLNYTSPLKGKDRIWLGGQLRKTVLYQATLQWPRKPAQH
ncbi:MAG: hypothetical protein N2170_01760 [Bacteroidia bacterium]|nr:hypothetical protein [Bacteroidia bacterium]